MTPEPWRALIPVLLVLLAVSVLLTDLENSGRSTRTRPRPNIVLIVADDLGYGDLGCYGADRQETPSLDKLAAQGMQFTDYHAAATVCFPSRVGLLTGRYQRRTGLPDDAHLGTREGLSKQETLLPELLQKAGYRTALIGKWHLGYQPEHHPLEHGFDHFVGFLGGNIDYHSHLNGSGRLDWWHGRERVREEGYATRLITDHARRFMRSCEEPFFLMVSHAAPHWPYQGPDDPPLRLGEEESQTSFVEDPSSRYQTMVGELDRSVEQIGRELDALGISGDTVVIFTSDNGPEWLPALNRRIGSSGPFRGGKGDLGEGGHRVPCLVSWPGHLRAGVSRQLVHALDLAPTILDIARVEPPADLVFDGRTLLPHLQRGEEPLQRPFFWEYSGRSKIHTRDRAVRQGPWKLHMTEAQQPRLYNLEEDPGEQTDLAERFPQKVDELRESWNVWFEPAGPVKAEVPVEESRTSTSSGMPVEIFRPKAEGPYPGVLLLHDQWGYNVWTREMAGRLASWGYLVVAPDLFEGRQVASNEQAAAVSQEMGRHSQVWASQIEPFLNRLQDQGQAEARWATVGIDRGGAVAQALAQRMALQAMVFYEAPFSDEPEAPTLAVYAADSHPGLQQQRQLDFPVELLLLEETPVGFLNPYFKPGYRPEAAQRTWRRVREFLDHRLKGW